MTEAGVSYALKSATYSRRSLDHVLVTLRFALSGGLLMILMGSRYGERGSREDAADGEKMEKGVREVDRTRRRRAPWSGQRSVDAAWRRGGWCGRWWMRSREAVQKRHLQHQAQQGAWTARCRAHVRRRATELEPRIGARGQEQTDVRRGGGGRVEFLRWKREGEMLQVGAGFDGRGRRCSPPAALTSHANGRPPHSPLTTVADASGRGNTVANGAGKSTRRATKLSSCEGPFRFLSIYKDNSYIPWAVHDGWSDPSSSPR